MFSKFNNMCNGCNPIFITESVIEREVENNVTPSVNDENEFDNENILSTKSLKKITKSTAQRLNALMKEIENRKN